MNSKLNKKQIGQIVIASLALVLIIVWIFMPGSISTKVVGIIANALLLLSMTLSFIAEEKKKKEGK
jgi:hypothetical protein